MHPLPDARLSHLPAADPGEAATFRVLVTGSRTWADEGLIRVAMTAMVVTARAARRRLIVVHGACPEGADALAHKVARKLGIPLEDIERHPAKWKEHGKQAGFIRNAEMVDAGADMCLAFIDQCRLPKCAGLRPHGTHGADHCRKLARRAHIPVRGFGFVPAGS